MLIAILAVHVMCRTVVVGGASAAQADKLEAVQAAVTETIAAVKPGVTVGAIRDVAAGAIARAGYGDNWWDAFMRRSTRRGRSLPGRGATARDTHPFASGVGAVSGSRRGSGP